MSAMRHLSDLRGRRRAPRSAALALAAVAIVGCGTAPVTHFHSLMPADIGARTGAAAASGIAVVLEPIRIPAQVDQPQWLVQLNDGSVALLEQERWASSLHDELRQALLEELIVGQGLVEARTQAAGAAAPWRIALDVRRFDSVPGREARSEGSWTITGGETRAATSRCEWLIREPAAGSFAALADAHRRGVARLGAALGAALARARHGEAPACPALDGAR